MGQAIAAPRQMMRTDGELLEASRRGERAAFGAIVERYQGVVCAVSYSRTRDQALSEDVAQDTFIAAWKQLDQLREVGRLRSWLCGIARNLARKARRRSDREQPVDEPVAIADENPFDAVCEAQAERVVGDALARVPETYRDVLVLYYREQRSARDVAQALGISEAAVLQRLARGRQYLADGLTALVEKSLRAPRKPGRDLVACVVAALPAIVPSRVDASPGSHGGNMLKLAIAAAVITAAGTTAYVVHSHAADRDPAAVVTAPPQPPAVAAKHAPAAPRIPDPPRAAAPSLPAGDQMKHRPELVPVIDRAQYDRLQLERGPSRGPASAPVTIVVFTDMICKYCGKALASLDQLVEEYPDKLRIVIKQMPVHEAAVLPAEAVFAADAQGKFWELHDLLLAHQDDLSEAKIVALAQQAGLDTTALRAALASHTYAARVNADKAAGAELEITGTPTFLINGRRVVGALPVADLRAVVDAALAERR